ncbi:hypothetical protein ACHAWF_003416 [Thalassiosira exigua]
MPFRKSQRSMARCSVVSRPFVARGRRFSPSRFRRRATEKLLLDGKTLSRYRNDNCSVRLLCRQEMTAKDENDCIRFSSCVQSTEANVTLGYFLFQQTGKSRFFGKKMPRVSVGGGFEGLACIVGQAREMALDDGTGRVLVRGSSRLSSQCILASTHDVTQRRYHEIFRLMFAPSRALAERVEKTMTSLDLVPSQYSSVHLRVKYPVRGVDEHTFTFRKHKSQIVQWATNAVNCAAELHPNSTIYVSSDNNDTVGYLLEESHFARHYVDATRHKKHPLVVRLVARDYSDENHHVAFSRETEGDSFMGVFEDLTIMGMGRCVAHGLGGYGRLGAALSGGECAVAHRGRNSRVCSDALAKMQSKIDA